MAAGCLSALAGRYSFVTAACSASREPIVEASGVPVVMDTEGSLGSKQSRMFQGSGKSQIIKDAAFGLLAIGAMTIVVMLGDIATHPNLSPCLLDQLSRRSIRRTGSSGSFGQLFMR
jgi:hypothetical protein